MSPDTGRRHFHEELDLLQDRLLDMAGRAEELVRIATNGVFTREKRLGKRVKMADIAIDELEVEIDERVVELLALQQPMGPDLRLIFASLKMSNDLERVGDHAVSIGRAARRLAKLPPLPEIRELQEMIRVTRTMLSDALGSFVARDTHTARSVCATDDRVDDLRRSLYRILLTHMLEDPSRITAALETLLITQHLERIADLSTNVAEDVVFLVEGRSIKHGLDPEDDEDDEEDEPQEAGGGGENRGN